MSVASESLNITFGIELEFICIYNDDQTFETLLEIEEDEGTHVAGCILKRFLTEHNVPVKPDAEEEDLDEDCDIFMDPREERYNLPYNTPDPLSYWSVKHDTSVELSESERQAMPTGFKQESIELSSPKYYLGRPGEFSIQLQNLLQALRRMESMFGCHFLTNESCGFHVHIGNGDTRLPIETVKRVMQLFLAHERNFDSLHAANRIIHPRHPSAWRAGESCQVPYFTPLSFLLRRSSHHAGAENLGFGGDDLVSQPHDEEMGLNVLDPFSMLARIEQANDYRDIGRFLEVNWQKNVLNGHSASVNFDQMFADPDAHRHEDELFKTIEFRQHAGTLEQNQIFAYVNLLLSAVGYCASAADEQFLSLLVKGADPEFKLKQLLNVLRLDSFAYISRDKQEELTAKMQSLSPARTHPDPYWVLKANCANLMTDNDPSVIADRLNEKLRGYYGWEPTAGSMPLTFSQITDLLTAARQISLNQSEARRMVFGSLSRIYQRLDSGLSQPHGEYLNDPVVAELTGRWGFPITT